RGYEIGGLYRPATNLFFNDHYKGTMEAFGGPIFAQGRKGTGGFVRHLRSGGMLVLLFDQRMAGGEMIPFMGRPAPTATSAADLALRYDALLIPFFGIRKENGLDFRIEIDAPIEHSTATQMMLELTQALEARLRENPDQWFWVHRRWGRIKD
ncbi:MAG: lysophospholipid acyltransferase family protein, partial [Paracoccaceae bacterium]|nr:lysophospholipid acyltransferase family protein [Paracoccaceae bacterium]